MSPSFFDVIDWLWGMPCCCPADAAGVSRVATSTNKSGMHVSKTGCFGLTYLTSANLCVNVDANLLQTQRTKATTRIHIA